MIHQLLKLNLTYAQIGSILKYTKGAYQLDEIPKDFDYLTKKPGYFGQKIVLLKSCSSIGYGTLLPFPALLYYGSRR